MWSFYYPDDMRVAKESSKAVTDARLNLATKTFTQAPGRYNKGKMAKLALSAVGYAYNAPPEHARYEFVARIPQNKFQSTVGAVGLNYKIRYSC